MILSGNDRAYCCEGRKSNEFITIRGKNELTFDYYYYYHYFINSYKSLYFCTNIHEAMTRNYA